LHAKFKNRHSDTLQVHFVGYEGYTLNLSIMLIQEYGLSPAIAERLVRTYGGRAYDVVQLAKDLMQRDIEQHNELTTQHFNNESSKNKANHHPHHILPLNERVLFPNSNILDAEIYFACYHDYALHVSDILARRTRLAFVDRDLAIRAMPKVIRIMSEIYSWSPGRQEEEFQACIQYMRQFGGPVPHPYPLTDNSKENQQIDQKKIRHNVTETEFYDAFVQVLQSHLDDSDQENQMLLNANRTKNNIANLYHQRLLDKQQVTLMSELLHYTITEDEIDDLLFFSKTQFPTIMDSSRNATEQKNHSQYPIITNYEAYYSWWNSDRMNPELVKLKEAKMAIADKVEGAGTLFG
jgi:hypothetical protein